MTKKTPDPIDIATGHRIRVNRLAKGMSQQKLAEGLGVTFQQVQKYEKGVNRVGAGRLTRIAEILSVSVASLIEDPSHDGKPALDASVLSSLASPGALALLKAYERIESRELQRSLVALAQQIAAECAAQPADDPE